VTSVCVALHLRLSATARAAPDRLRTRSTGYQDSCKRILQRAVGGLRFFSTSASVIIIIIGSTGHS